MNKKFLISMFLLLSIFLVACSDDTAPSELTSVTTNSEDSGDILLQKRVGTAFVHYNTVTGGYAKKAKNILAKGNWVLEDTTGVVGSYKFVFTNNDKEVYQGMFVDGNKLSISETTTGYTAVFKDKEAQELYKYLFNDNKKISENQN